MKLKVPLGIPVFIMSIFSSECSAHFAFSESSQLYCWLVYLQKGEFDQIYFHVFHNVKTFLKLVYHTINFLPQHHTHRSFERLFREKHQVWQFIGNAASDGVLNLQSFQIKTLLGNS